MVVCGVPRSGDGDGRVVCEGFSCEVVLAVVIRGVSCVIVI
jgi:hypothetical protein